MTTNALLPCPFCGYPPVIEELGHDPDECNRWRARCSGCNIHLTIYGERGEAIEAWNRRAAPAPPPRDEAIAMIAERLFEKFGVQCGMGELAMWRPIARAALDAAPAQPTPEWRDTDAICPTCGTDTSLIRRKTAPLKSIAEFTYICVVCLGVAILVATIPVQFLFRRRRK